MLLSNDEGAWQQDLRTGLLRVGAGAERLMLLLALMPYHPQEGIPLDNHGDRLPAWLRQSLARDQPNSCSNPA